MKMKNGNNHNEWWLLFISPKLLNLIKSHLFKYDIQTEDSSALKIFRPLNQPKRCKNTKEFVKFGLE